MASTWRWLGRRREREVIGNYMKHLSAVEETLAGLAEVIKGAARGRNEAAQAYKKVYESERAADRVKQEILTLLSEEHFHPLSREELVRLTLTTDDVANFAKSASRRILMLTEIAGGLRADFLEGFAKITGMVLKQVELLKDAATLLVEDVKEALKKADEVERIEEEVDEIRSALEERLFKECHVDLSISECLLYAEVTLLLEGASDKCEDVGDVIRSIALLE